MLLTRPQQGAYLFPSEEVRSVLFRRFTPGMLEYAQGRVKEEVLVLYGLVEHGLQGNQDGLDRTPFQARTQ